MKTYNEKTYKTAKKSFCFGTLSKGNLIFGVEGDVFEVIGETKAYYITTNPVNPKLPKWIVD